MNEIGTTRLREAMRRADVEELEDAVDAIGRNAVAQALAERPPVVAPPAAERFKPLEEEERQQRPRLRGGEVDRIPANEGLQWPKKPELVHARAILGSSYGNDRRAPRRLHRVQAEPAP